MASHFHVSISKILDNWTAFQLAINQGCGGVHTREKAEWMVGVIEQWFSENAGIESDELEGFIEDILSNEFDLFVDDGTLETVSENIVECYALCKKKKIPELEAKLSAFPKAKLDQCRIQEAAEEDDDDDVNEDMETEASSGVQSLGASANQSQPSAPPSQANGDTHEQNKDSAMQEEDDGWTVISRTKKK